MARRARPQARFWSTTAVEIVASILFVAALGAVFAFLQQL